MMSYVLLFLSLTASYLMGYRIGRLKERLSHEEKQVHKNRLSAEISARPHSSASALRDRMRSDGM